MDVETFLYPLGSGTEVIPFPKDEDPRKRMNTDPALQGLFQSGP
jgi:hypothetical protein